MNHATGGNVNGPTMMDIRPCQPGETPEAILYPDGTIYYLGGILVPRRVTESLFPLPTPDGERPAQSGTDDDPATSVRRHPALE